MSTRIGTLEAPRPSRSIWPAAIIVSLAMLTIGIGAFFLGRDQATRTSKPIVGGTEQTVVGGTVANTPSELSGGVVGGLPTNAVGISAGSSSLAVAASPDVMAMIIAARNTADADPGKLGSGTAGNTPTELGGGMFERYGRHQRI
jgi:hypothetical protein